MPSSISEPCGNLIRRLLDRDPTRRLGADSVEDVKQHQWLADVDWEKISDKKLPMPIQPEKTHIDLMTGEILLSDKCDFKNDQIASVPNWDYNSDSKVIAKSWEINKSVDF